MTQKTSPFVEGKYGWELGESGWNTGMDENIVKFSFLFDSNIDGVVATLPAAVNGKAYYLTSDKRVYYVVGGVYYSSPVPLWHVFKNRADGTYLIFNGTTLVSAASNLQLSLDIAGISGDIAESLEQAKEYTDQEVSTYSSELQDISDLSKGATLVGGALRHIDNINTLRLHPGRYNGDQISLVSHTAYGVGGGQFYWDASSNETDNNGTIVKVTTVTTGRWKRKLKAVTPYEFGAYGNGVIDDSVALQAAIDYAQDNTGELDLGDANYLISITPVQTKALFVRGRGRNASKITYSGANQGWLAKPPYATSNTNWIWEDFSLVPLVPGGGTSGLHIQLSPVNPTVCYLADSRVKGMFIGDFGGRGLWLDNSVANIDGFFTSQFINNVIVNGILGTRVGDSLTFSYNKIYGRNCGIEMIGVPGAREMVIQENNITTTGGTIALLNVESPTLKDNQLEHPGYLSGYTGSYDCGMYLNNCYMPLIISNTINSDNGAAVAPVSPGLPTSTIAMDGTTSFAVFRGNDIQKGSIYHINIGEASVLDTLIDETNRYYGANPAIGDSGTGTIKPTVRTSIAYDPPLLNNGDTVSVNIPLIGAEQGQFASASLSTIQPGVDVSCIIYPNSVTVQFYNRSGAAVDMASGTLRVRVSS